jgi:hypothetical protein
VAVTDVATRKTLPKTGACVLLYSGELFREFFPVYLALSRRASHLPFPSAPSLGRHLWLTQQPACPSLLWFLAALCVFCRRGRPHLFSSPTRYRDSRPQSAAGRARHRSSEAPSSHDSKRTCCYSVLESPSRLLVTQEPVRWRLEVIASHPHSFPGTRVPPSGALTVLLELVSSLEATSRP